MRALVTGGGGFLGRAIVERLVARGTRVRNLARGEYPELSALGVESIRGDLTATEVVERACRDIDVVFHVAARAGVWGPDAEYHRINVEGTQKLLDAARAARVGKFVYTSSPSVVFSGGDCNGADESLPYPEQYDAPYPRSKAKAERMVLRANSDALATVALRPHLIWGPRDNHLLPRILERAATLRRIGNANKLIDSTYIDNAADAHLNAADRLNFNHPCAGRAYFISNGEPWPTWDLINALLAAADRPPITRNIGTRTAMTAATVLELTHRALRLSGEPRLTRFVVKELTTAHWFDISAARRDLGYAPAVSIDEGLQRLRAWLVGG